MGKSEVLRGYGRFRDVLTRGKRIRAKLLHASYIISDENGQRVRIGVSVPKWTGKAVTRNRVKRLIRESARREKLLIRLAAEESHTCVDIVLQFRSIAPERKLSLHEIQPDVKIICGQITAKLKQKV